MFRIGHDTGAIGDHAAGTTVGLYKGAIIQSFMDTREDFSERYASMTVDIGIFQSPRYFRQLIPCSRKRCASARLNT